MDADELVRRARQAMQTPTLYFLGAGGYAQGQPRPPHPGNRARIGDMLAALQRDDPPKFARYLREAQAAGIDLEALAAREEPVPFCDCSGFVTWALGLPRRYRALASAEILWRSTASIYEMARAGRGGFRRVDNDAARLSCGRGDMLVYPSPRTGEPGHIGIVTEVEGGQPVQVIHCSSLNQTLPRPAQAPLNSIAETDAQLFREQLAAALPTVAVAYAGPSD